MSTHTSVLWTTDQGLTTTQKAQARRNIDAASSADVLAAKTEVVQGTGVNVSEATGANGQKVYTISNAYEAPVQSDWNESDNTKQDYIKNKPANLVQDASYVHTDNNFTNTLKSKLEGIEAGAEVNVQSDWNQSDNTADDYIKNKPSNLVQDASYVHTDNNFTTTLKNKLDGIAACAEVNVQSDWNQTNSSADDYIKNKPSNLVQDASYVHTDNNFTNTLKSKLDGIAAGAEVNVQSNWNQTDSTADDYIKNKPENLVQDASYVHTDNNFTTTLKNKLDGIAAGAEVNVQSDWNQTNTSADDYIKNKPSNLVQDASYVHTDNNFTTTLKNKLDGIAAGAEVNVQSDWNQTTTTADDYIKNKPTIPEVVMIQNTQGGASESTASKLSIDQDFTTVSLKIDSTDVGVGYLVPNAPQGATTKKILNLPNGQGNPLWTDPDPTIVYVSTSDTYATVNGYRQAGYEVILRVYPTADNPLHQDFRLSQYNPDGSMEFECIRSGSGYVVAYKYGLNSSGVWTRTDTSVSQYTGIQIDGVGRNLHLNQNNYIQTNLPGGVFNAPVSAGNSFERLSGADFAGAYMLACRHNVSGTYEIAIAYTASGTSSTYWFLGTETIVATDNTVTTKQAVYNATAYYTPSNRFGGTQSTAFDPNSHKAIIYNGIGLIGPCSDCKIVIYNDNGTVKLAFTAIEVGKVGSTN
jgi:hypothetical protein